MIRYTAHAHKRKQERVFNHLDVLKTIQEGVRLVNRTDPNKWTYVHNDINLYVVTNKESNIVITLFKKEL